MSESITSCIKTLLSLCDSLSNMIKMNRKDIVEIFERIDKIKVELDNQKVQEYTIRSNVERIQNKQDRINAKVKSDIEGIKNAFAVEAFGWENHE